MSNDYKELNTILAWEAVQEEAVRRGLFVLAEERFELYDEDDTLIGVADTLLDMARMVNETHPRAYEPGES